MLVIMVDRQQKISKLHWLKTPYKVPPQKLKKNKIWKFGPENKLLKTLYLEFLFQFQIF